jgi:hypothetical protein
MDSATITLILILAAIIMLVAISVADRFRSRRAMLGRIADAWGKEPAAKYKPEDFLSIASYFANRGKEHEAGFAIDDITWRDLDMDDVFVRLNNTGSTIGEECLYKLLREPSFEPEVLTERQRLIAYFQNDPAKRLELQILLAKLYRSVHFQEVISNEGIFFDYRIYEGRATSTNAIKLLSLIGYSNAIVHEAEKHADLFMEQGTWQAIS